MSEIKLLPCPICNKEVSIALMGSEEFHYWWMITRGTNKVGNKNCHCRLFMESEKFTNKNGGEEHKQDLIEKWNTRKPMELIVERLEELENITLDQYNNSMAGTYEHDFADGKDCGLSMAIDIVRNGGKE